MNFEEEPKRSFDFGIVALFLQKKRSWGMKQRLKKPFLLCFKANPELVLALYIYKEEENVAMRFKKRGEKSEEKQKKKQPKKEKEEKNGYKVKN